MSKGHDITARLGLKPSGMPERFCKGQALNNTFIYFTQECKMTSSLFRDNNRDVSMLSCFMVETCGGCNLGQSGRDVDIDSPQHQHDCLFLTVQYHFPLLWDPGGEGHSCRCCVQTCGVSRCISSTTALTTRPNQGDRFQYPKRSPP